MRYERSPLGLRLRKDEMIERIAVVYNQCELLKGRKMVLHYRPVCDYRTDARAEQRIVPDPPNQDMGVKQ
jgi:hypothetical protein